MRDNKYVVIQIIKYKDEDDEHKYCEVFNDFNQFDRYVRSKNLDTNLYKLTSKGIYERKTNYSYEKIIVNCVKSENLIIHNEVCL